MFRRDIPEIDTTSTADISFILLIFFLVATSFNTYKGIGTNVPPDNQEQIDKTQLKARNVLQLTINADNTLTHGDSLIAKEQLSQLVRQFIENPTRSAMLPEYTEENIPGIGRCRSTYNHRIIITIDKDAHYDSYYFLQNTIHNTYAMLRDEAAMRHVGTHYDRLTPDRQHAVRRLYPMHISEEIAAEIER